jgi:hypothetical protein
MPIAHALAGDERVVAQQAAVEACEAPGHEAADVAEPTMPTVLPASSRPMKFFFSHLPARVEMSAGMMWRYVGEDQAMTSSATALALAPGVFITSTPRLRACLMSMVS